MRWPWRRKGGLGDREGMERAKTAYAVAKAIEVHADVIEAQTRQIQVENHLGPRIQRALGGRG